MKQSNNATAHYKVIGLMSGTSLDGLDMAYCEFSLKNGQWQFQIPVAETAPYDEVWAKLLTRITEVNGEELIKADLKLGQWMGEAVRAFIEKNHLNPDFISSHGHTVFHQPETGLTYQIGNGFALQAACEKPVVSNFRNFDLVIGGQGAPLVPVGDQLLFSNYDFCLNLGGIANVSTDFQGKRIAYDIGPANMALNHFARKLGHTYDPEGSIAAGGKVNKALLDHLNQQEYYRMPFPKSLGYEWVLKHIIQPTEAAGLSAEDALATCTHHSARQIAANLLMLSEKRGGEQQATTLVTGGGAFNKYFISCMEQYSQEKIAFSIPDGQLVAYKEALVFALLGALRVRNEVNCLSSVTGSAYDHSAGVIYGVL